MCGLPQEYNVWTTHTVATLHIFIIHHHHRVALYIFIIYSIYLWSSFILFIYGTTLFQNSAFNPQGVPCSRTRRRTGTGRRGCRWGRRSRRLGDRHGRRCTHGTPTVNNFVNTDSFTSFPDIYNIAFRIRIPLGRQSCFQGQTYIFNKKGWVLILFPFTLNLLFLHFFIIVCAFVKSISIFYLLGGGA